VPDPTETHRAIRAVWTLEAAKLIARLTRMVRDVGRAEELAQDALVVALETWPVSGIPDSPGAWLMTTAKNRAINEINRNRMLERKHEQLGHEQSHSTMPDFDDKLDDDVGDDVLRLVFISCHPVLSSEARVALTLRMLGGLATDEIARAFLVPEPTIAQRIVRAKKTLAEANVPFELPRGDDRQLRLASVLEVIYLVFNEGYSATSGADLLRPAMCEEALRLGRVLATLMPDEPEVHGLAALMELHGSRLATRVTPTGEPVLLLEQERMRWDQLLIRRGLASLARAELLSPERGPYTLLAAISACHARALDPATTNWAQIAALYGEMSLLRPSPVIELNRAVAISMAEGPGAGLAIIDAIADAPALRSYHLLPAARADMLAKLGRFEEARSELERAASLTRNERERELLLQRAATCARGELPSR
jgi:RNA polymerase sigma-70 factor, ECF subfamily